MNNWKKILSLSQIYYIQLDQYFSSYELPKNRLLLNSFSTQFKTRTECYYEYIRQRVLSHSKIIFIDLNNFKEINSTEQFNIDVKHIILESSIVIQDDHSLLLYDIHSLEFIGRKFLKNNDNVFKYDNQHLIIIYEKEAKIRLYIYKYKNKDFIKFCKIKINLKELLFFIKIR